MQSFTKVLGRLRDLYKDPGKASAITQTFLKKTDLPCHVTKRKDPMQRTDLCKGPGKGMVP